MKKNAVRAGRIVAAAHSIFAAGFLLLLAAVEWIGERNWLSALALYVPPQAWLLPLALLAPAALFLRPRFLLVDVACVAFVIFIFFHPRSHNAPARGDNLLTVVTNNFGQNNHQSPEPFLKKYDPDVLVLQETGNADAWKRTHPDRFVDVRGEFIIVTKLPLKNAALVPGIAWLGRPVAARFELNFHGVPFVIYSVHMPTPRPDFAKLRGLGFVKEMLGRNRRASDGRDFSESMTARIELAKKLCAVFSREEKPFVVAGDFNTPDHGHVYHLFAAQLTDAFAKSGNGFGLTFPGTTHNPLTGFGPWMRLDQAFAGRGFEPAFCEAEPSRRSQHRALVAIFKMTKK